MSVSVIIPAWNAAHLLPRSIGSALRQTLPPLEILVVDDGSTDATAEVAAAFGSPVRVIRQENRGLSGARNTAIRAAQGEWVALLDADDEWLPEKLERQMARAAQYPNAGLIYSDAWLVDLAGQATHRYLEGREAPNGWAWDALLLSSFVMPSTAVMRRATVLEAGLFSEHMRLVEDLDMWLRMARLCPFALVPECLTRYYQQENSLSRNQAGMARSEALIFEQLLTGANGPALNAGQRRKVRQRLARRLFDLAWHDRRADPRGALRAAWRSVRLDPAHAASWKLLAANAAVAVRSRA